MAASNTASQASEELTWPILRSKLAKCMALTHPKLAENTQVKTSTRTGLQLAQTAVNNHAGVHLQPMNNPPTVSRRSDNSISIPMNPNHSGNEHASLIESYAPLERLHRTLRYLMDLLEIAPGLVVAYAQPLYDDGTEAIMEGWICGQPSTSIATPLLHILVFLQEYFVIRLLLEEGLVPHIRSTLNNISFLGIHDAPHPNRDTTAVDKIVGLRLEGNRYDVVTLVEFKTWSLSLSTTDSPPVTQHIDDAVQQHKALKMEDPIRPLLEGNHEQTARKAAHATIGQVFEQLFNMRDTYTFSPNARLLLTGVYGHQYHAVYNKEANKNELLWSANLASEKALAAATSNQDRSCIEVNEEILDFFFDALYEDLEKAIERWLNPTPPTVPTPTAGPSLTSSLSQIMGTTLSGYYVPSLWTRFRLASVVLSDVMDPLRVETSWPRLPVFPLYLKLKLIWAGNNFVWSDTEMGIVFKQYPSADRYTSELGFYRRLAHLSWVPTVLGTVSTAGRWGVFTSYAGNSIHDNEWEEAVPVIQCWVKELHSLGIHHHDLACRNILKGPTGSFTLIDFDNAVESSQCDPSECPDLEELDDGSIE